MRNSLDRNLSRLTNSFRNGPPDRRCFAASVGQATVPGTVPGQAEISKLLKLLELEPDVQREARDDASAE